MKVLLLTLVVYCLIAQIYGVRTNQEIKRWFIQQGIECSKDHPVTTEELHQIKTKHKAPESPKSKCLLACVFKRIEWMDDKSMFDVERATQTSTRDFANDPAMLEKAKELYDICKNVNTKSVSDGDFGCERAKLLALCFTENAPKLGFLI